MPRTLKVFQDDSLLDDIQVASPCPALWSDMVGSDTVRFCASCQKNVFNLSGMRRDEALDLLRATEGRVCVRFYRRADGTVLTEDCPVGVAAVLRRAKRMTLAAAAVSLGAVAAVLAVLGGAFMTRTCRRIDDARTRIEDVMPDDGDGGLTGKLVTRPPEVEQGGAVPVLGEAVAPPAPPPPTMGKPRLPPRQDGVAVFPPPRDRNMVTR